MLKTQIATLAPRQINRLVAFIIVASVLLGSNMFASTVSASQADTSLIAPAAVAKDPGAAPDDVNLSSKHVISTDGAGLPKIPVSALAETNDNMQDLSYKVRNLSFSLPSVETLDSDGIALASNAANNKNGVLTTPGPLLAATQPNDGFVYIPQIPLSEELQAYTYQKSMQHGLDYTTILALMWRESRFSISAVGYNTNGTRDHGVMQINDVNKGWLYNELGISNLMDPKQNIDAGTEMLGRFRSKHGMHNALLAYQYGEAGMQRKLVQGVTTNSQVQALYSKGAEFQTLLDANASTQV